MGKLIINQQNVNKEIADKLINVCPFNAIEYVNNELKINEACRLCKLCTKKGLGEAIVFQEEQIREVLNKSLWKGVCVFVEHDGNDIHPVTFELIGKARELAKVVNHEVYAILFTDKANKFTDSILSYGVDKAYVYEDEMLKLFNVEHYTNAMADFINKVKPNTILYGGTAIGRSFAPRVAARFRTGLTADCIILEMKENTDLIQNRPAFGGNVMASIICPNNRPQMATVRSKMFKMPEVVKPFGQVIKMSTDKLDFKTNINLLDIKQKEKNIDISEAEVIVACGRAFKNKEDLAIAEELAFLLNGHIAGTRPLIENGLIDAKKQIGQSGRTVAPKLLITLGISGAVQFTSGMKGSEVIFSICNQKDANIFDVSHYGIVGDVFQILPELIKSIKIMKGLI